MEQPINAAPMPSNESLEERRRIAIQDWRNAIEPAKEWQAYERAKRAEVVAVCFPSPIKGTNRFALDDGSSIKMTYSFTYTLGDKDLVDPELGEKVPIDTQVNAVLTAIEQLGPEAALLAKRLVKWKPELVETEYRKLRKDIQLETEIKKLIDSILTVKPASPQLQLEPPK